MKEMEQKMRYVIHNGRICDGSGSPSYDGDILIEDGRIEKIVRREGEREGLSRGLDGVHIDAGGKVITPGFIDTHRHCDLAVLCDEDFGTLELSQGLTSVAGGNCGLGIFPYTPEYGRQMADFVEPCIGISPVDLQIGNYSRYIKLLEGKDLPLHVGCYQGIGAVKAAVKGYGKSPFTAKEMDRAKGYIKEALEAGCIGVSSGIMYQPECYTSKQEMEELLKAAAPYGQPLACHIRGEGDNLVSSVEEIIGICKGAGIPLNISHFKATGIKNWGKNIHQAIELIEKARAEGEDVTVDFYPYCGGSTTLISLIPPDMMEEDMNLTFRRMESKEGREKLCRSIYQEHKGWDNMVTAIGWERILISSVTTEENRELTGLNFLEAACKRGYEEPAHLMAELLAGEDGKVGIILLSMSQEDVDTVAKLPYSMVISDALYGVSDCPHPRLYGAFPRFLQDYVVKRKIFALEQAVHKMTAMPAKRLNLRGRGLIREGFWADLNIFSLEEFRDYAVYENSRQLSAGLSYVFADGRIAMQDGKRQEGVNADLLKSQR